MRLLFVGNGLTACFKYLEGANDSYRVLRIYVPGGLFIKAFKFFIKIGLSMLCQFTSVGRSQCFIRIRPVKKSTQQRPDIEAGPADYKDGFF